MIKLFLAAFMQVSLVAMNVVFISRGHIVPMFLTGFGISLIWTFNVKRISGGELQDKFAYATGAGLGTVAGYFLAKFLTLVM